MSSLPDRGTIVGRYTAARPLSARRDVVANEMDVATAPSP